MVGTNSPSSVDPTYLRKIRKPLVEKRRRDRMNNSLAQLKSLLAANIKQNSSTSMARLDKADILELTVRQLTTLGHQQRSVFLATEVDGYKKGFKDCARETIRYLSSTQALDTDSVFRLNNHLQSCYVEKTRKTSTMSHFDEVQHAHVITSPNEMQSAGHDNNMKSNPPLYGTVTSSSIAQPVPDNYYSNDNYYQLYCHPCNDSIDSSLNSSCNMSLDSSSNFTPEKVPYQAAEGDVWRPW